MKKKKIFLLVLLIIVILVIVAIYYFMTKLEVKNDKILLINYKSIPVTEEDIERINDRKLEYADNYDMWKMKKILGSEYGNLFVVFYNLEYKRYDVRNDYRVIEKIDFSDLSEEEKVFFAKVNGDTDSVIFDSEEREDKTRASNCVYLKGITYGKSMEELEKIIRKVKITLLIQDKNGRIFEKKVSVSDSSILQEKESEYDPKDEWYELKGSERKE